MIPGGSHLRPAMAVAEFSFVAPRGWPGADTQRTAGWRPDAAAVSETDPETVRRLRSLGYIR
jgi:hypothetical protein